MAKRVGYFQNFATPEESAEAFSEGPFVIVNAGGWRIEAELVGHYCPVHPDLSIYKLREALGYRAGKFNQIEEAERLCDHLNALVREGKIALDGTVWKATEHV